MFDKENVMRIDFVNKIGNYSIEMVALFNKNRMTEQQAVEAIRLEGIRENENIIFISKNQFNNVFLEDANNEENSQGISKENRTKPN